MLPMGRNKDRKRRQRKAFDNGLRARMDGVPLNFNPHEGLNNDLAKEWSRGWLSVSNEIKDTDSQL